MSSGISTAYELSSFESSRNISTEPTQIISKTKSDIVSYKKHTKVSLKIIYIISFGLTCVSLFYPWSAIRQKALKSFNELIQSGLPTRTMRLAQIVGTTLDKYKMSSMYLASLFSTPNLFDTNFSNIYNLVKYAKSTHSSYSVKPSDFFVLTPENTFYQISFSNNISDIFVLYVRLEIEGKTILKQFPSSRYNFTAEFDPINTGDIVSTIPGPITNLPPKNVEWTNAISIEGDHFTPLLYSLAYSDVLNRTIGISLKLQNLFHVFNSGTVRRNMRFVFMGLDGGVLFENNQGIVPPMIVDGNPVFRQLDNLGSTFWDEIKNVNFMNNIQQEVIINDTEYVVRLDNVTSNNELTHNFIFVVEKENVISEPLYCSALYFLILIVVLMVLFAIADFCKIHNEEKCQNRLSRQESNFLPEIESIESCSTLKHCISQLRSIELLYPEEIILNQVLDKVVANLCEKRFRSFTQKAQPDCDFCQHMITENNPIKFKSEPCFGYWRTMASHTVNPRSPLTFSVEECEHNPEQYLMKMFLKIVLVNQLTFEIFDPDNFIQFIFHFCVSLCSDCITASFVLYDVYRTLNRHFAAWIKNKIDFLAIYFATIIYFTDSSSLEEAAEHDENARIQMDALSDNGSKFRRKTAFILDVFAEYFPGIEELEMFIYFRETVTNLLFNTQDFKLLDILGEFRVRIESPDFSALDDDKDKILFLSALVKFCHFGAYFQEEEIMKYLVEIMNKRIFTLEELRDRVLVSEFHYEHASKIASFWLKCFTQFTEMNDKTENLEKTIRYWEGEMSIAIDERNERNT